MLNSFSKWQVDCEPRETKYIWFSLSVWKTEKSQLPLLSVVQIIFLVSYPCFCTSVVTLADLMQGKTVLNFDF